MGARLRGASAEGSRRSVREGAEHFVLILARWGMESPPTVGRAVDLWAVRVRPTHGASAHRLWDRFDATHHYLLFGGLFGKGLRQVKTLGPT